MYYCRKAHTEACRERLERLCNEEQAEVRKLQEKIDAVRAQLDEQGEVPEGPVVVQADGDEVEMAEADLRENQDGKESGRDDSRKNTSSSGCGRCER